MTSILIGIFLPLGALATIVAIIMSVQTSEKRDRRKKSDGSGTKGIDGIEVGPDGKPFTGETVTYYTDWLDRNTTKIKYKHIYQEGKLVIAQSFYNSGKIESEKNLVSQAYVKYNRDGSIDPTPDINHR